MSERPQILISKFRVLGEGLGFDAVMSRVGLKLTTSQPRSELSTTELQTFRVNQYRYFIESVFSLE